MLMFGARGSNSCNQLCLGDTNNHKIPTRLEGFQFKHIISGGAHNVAIDMKGNVWVWGDNGRGQLGLGDSNNRNIPTLNPHISFSTTTTKSARNI